MHTWANGDKINLTFNLLYFLLILCQKFKWNQPTWYLPIKWWFYFSGICWEFEFNSDNLQSSARHLLPAAQSNFYHFFAGLSSSGSCENIGIFCLFQWTTGGFLNPVDFASKQPPLWTIWTLLSCDWGFKVNLRHFPKKKYKGKSIV